MPKKDLNNVIGLSGKEKVMEDIAEIEKNCYTYQQTCSEIGEQNLKIDGILKIIEIVLSGVTTLSVFTIIFGNIPITEIAGVIFSFALFILSGLLAYFKYAEKATKYTTASSSLFGIAKECDYLLSDILEYDLKELREKRTDLNNRYIQIMEKCPIKKKPIPLEKAIEKAYLTETNYNLVLDTRAQKAVSRSKKAVTVSKEEGNN